MPDSPKDFYLRNNCRLCEAPTKVVMELASTPPANELVTSEFIESGEIQDKFPLPVAVCSGCGHVQLAAVVNPERLFRKYFYTSGVSPVFRDHFKNYAADIVRDFDLKPGDLVVDIGSNDGILLKYFKEHGVRVVGVDPAENIAKLAEEGGVRTIAEFFGKDIACSIKEEFGSAKAIFANNVFAHSDFLDDITAGIAELLSDDGVFVFEVSYLPNVIQGTLFDTIYHEHLSYHHLSPLVSFFERFNLKLFNAHLVSTQGGSVRGFVGKPSRETKYGLTHLIEAEARLGLKTSHNESDGTAPILALNEKINSLRDQLIELLHGFKLEGKMIVGFGAPAKCVTMMHHFGFGSDIIDYIVDDSPIKQNMFIPGKNIEILPVSTLYEKKPDYVIILVWNFAKNIMERNQKFIEQGGKFIVPIPEIAIHG